MANQTQNTLTHRSIALRYKFAIVGTLSLLIIENVITVAVPYLIGMAIDDLIAKSNDALYLFFGVMMAALFVGVVRRLYDTRVYGRIYRESASEVIEKEIAKNADISKMTARATFVSDFTNFFEHDMPAAFMAVFMLFGSVIMLAIISPILSFGTIGVALTIGLIFFFSRKKIQRFNAGLNDEMEHQVVVLETRDAAKANRHFSALVRWRIRLSDLEARNFGLGYFFAFVLLSVAIYVLIAVEGKSVGQAFAGLTYIIQFTEAVIILPFTYQSYLRTEEISNRLADGKVPE